MELNIGYILAIPLIMDGTEHWVYVLEIFPYPRWN